MYKKTLRSSSRDLILGAIAFAFLYGSPAIAQIPWINLIQGNDESTGDQKEWFGHAIHSGADWDFNNDGDPDLVVGAPGHDEDADEDNIGTSYLFLGPLGTAGSTKAEFKTVSTNNDPWQFGHAVTFTEFTEDSYSDVLIGGPLYGYSPPPNEDQTDRGDAFLYAGNNIKDVDWDFRLRLSNTADKDFFGTAVAHVGHYISTLDSDSLVVAVGAPQDGNTGTGKVGVYFERKKPTTPGVITEDILVTGEQAGDQFGQSIAGGGDFLGADSDEDDFIVGAPKYDGTGGSMDNVGRVYVFTGFVDTVTIPTTISAGTIDSDTHPCYITGQNAGDRFGDYVVNLGDINAGGKDDFGVTATEFGALDIGVVYIFLGEDTGLTGAVTAADRAVLRIDGPGIWFGEPAAGIGDVNNDGFDDFASGYWIDESSTGRTYVFYGGDRYVVRQESSNLPTIAAANLAKDIFYGQSTNDEFGYSITAVGDANSDGLNDFAVGARTDNDPSSGGDTGAVFIYDSSPLLVDVSNDSDIAYPGETPYASVSINFDAMDTSQSGDQGPDLLFTLEGAQGQLWKRGGTSGGAIVYVDASNNGFVAEEDRLVSGHRGAVVADYNNDGRQDVFVAHASTPRLLKGVYSGPIDGEQLEDEIEILTGADKSVAGAWGDYDRDGLLDLYVVRASGTLTPTDITGEQDKLFRYDYDDTGDFIDVTSDVGMTTSSSKTIAASWCDIDLDGDLDLYVASLGDDEDGYLYESSGYEFTDRVNEATAPSIDDYANTTGLAWADLDRDEDQDLILSFTGIATNDTDVLALKNDGSGLFTEQSWIDTDDYTQGIATFDFDLNGWVDVLSAPASSTTPRLFGNFSGATMKFVSREERAGLTAEKAAAGVTPIDHDGDGDLDLYIGRSYTTQEGPSDFFFEARPNSQTDVVTTNWIAIELDAQSCNNRAGIGATIEADNGNFSIVKQVGASMGRGGQEGLITNFGLGESRDAVTVTVTWPDGYSQSDTYTYSDDEFNEFNEVHTITENSHNPAIVDSSFEFFIQPKVSEVADWVIQWESEHAAHPTTLEATVSESTKNGPTCYDPSGGGSSRLVAAGQTHVTATVTVLANGRYLNKLVWAERPCTSTCTYSASDPSCATRENRCEDNVSSGSDTATVSACLQ